MENSKALEADAGFVHRTDASRSQVVPGDWKLTKKQQVTESASRVPAGIEEPAQTQSGKPNLASKPVKPAVFQMVNGSNHRINNGTGPSTGVTLKFKISRGTQATITTITSPPVPAKPPGIGRPVVKPSPPPVPPKPNSYKLHTSPPKPPVLSPKPALPPKPVFKSGLPVVPAAPTRMSRRDKVDAKPSSPVQLVVGQQARKCSSLGRLEGLRCSKILAASHLYHKADDRNLHRDSGFVSCSLENVDHSLDRVMSSAAQLMPVAPPRRRRKSADSYVEPIYAVVDFSKKLNRRFPTNPVVVSDCKIKISATDAIEQQVEKTEMTSSVETECRTVCMTSDIQMIESSYATITSIMNSFNQPAGESSSASHLHEVQPETKDSTDRNPIISRLVVGGAVVQQTDLVQEPTDDVVHPSKKLAEFKDVVTPPSPCSPDSLVADLPSPRARQPSPTPSSVSSNSSVDSKEEDSPSGELFDPDVVSAGSLGDIDTSDATRQDSVEEDSSSAPVDASSKENQGSQVAVGFRRTLDNLFGSLGKAAGARKGNEKRRTLDLETNDNSSSTDTDQQQRQQVLRPHLCATRTAPSIPGQKFNRVARIYRSVQPQEKVRANSLDAGQLIYSHERGSKSLSPIDSSPVASSVENAKQTSTNQDDERKTEKRPSSAVDSVSEAEEEKDDLTVSLQGKERKAYLTAKEIASSERVFVDCLRLICVDFRATVMECSDSSGRDGPVIPETELNRILSYLPHLQSLNQELLSDFELRVKYWAVEPKIADVIVRKGPFLKLYSAYIRDFQAQSALLDECIQKYPRFGKVLKQFEMSDRCKNLSLKHYMLKPVQRLPQYRLLLDVYLRHLTESSPDYQDTVTALKVVTEVADHANNSMKQEDNFQKLMRLQSRLGNCEIIKPGRYIIKEGELDKVSRKIVQPRYFILLNDCLLYTSYLTSPSPNCSLKLHHELSLSRMEVQVPPINAASTKESGGEFNVISTVRSFTLSTSSTALRDEWVTAIEQAISQLQSKQSTFPTKSAATESLSSEHRLGQQAPVWIPDSRVTMCQLCTTAFSITFRRHHCRACGKVVCRNCSSRKAELEYLKFRSARVCDDCYIAIKDGGALEDDLDASTCSSITEPDVSASLVNVPPVCYVHAFQDEHHLRPSSDPVGQSATQAGYRAQQARREHIRKERRYIPQRLMEVSASDTGSQMSGYLSRRTKRSVKKNWFVLKDRVLYIYKASEDVVALDTIPVLGYHVKVPQEEADESELMFQLFHPKQPPIVFQAETAALAKKWIEALTVATVL